MRELTFITGTVALHDGLASLIRSIDAQTGRDRCELIIVDQTNSDRVSKLLQSSAPTFPVRLLASSLGLSRARNTGLAEVQTPFVAFPDDDCILAENFVEEALAELHRTQGSACIGQQLDSEGQPILRTAGTRAVVDMRSVWRVGMSSAIVIRKSELERIGNFDEQLGLAPRQFFGSGEETDLLIRLLRDGGQVSFCPSLIVHHPPRAKSHTGLNSKVALSYGRGFGGVLRKHRYPLHEALPHFARPLVGSALAAFTGNVNLARFRFLSFLGRVHGYMRGSRLRRSED